MIPKSKILATSSGGPSGMRMNSSQIKTIQAATKIGYNVTEPNQTQNVTVNIGKDIQEYAEFVDELIIATAELVRNPSAMAEKMIPL